MSRRILLFTADKNKGKTTYVQNALTADPWQALRSFGMLSVANRAKSEYTLVDITNGEKRLALSADRVIGEHSFGRFSVDQAAYSWANERILSRIKEAELLLFDEIGMLELASWGFAPSFSAALTDAKGLLVATVRTTNVEAVRIHFGIDEATVRRIDYE